nr:hypothetical protein [Tanacetum cinerariifolium]
MDVEEPILDDVVNDADQPQDDADPKNDKSTSTERKYYASITKTKAARYELEGIEEMIPRLWIPIKVAYDMNDELGIYHWGPKQEIVVRRVDKKEYAFKEGDLLRLHLNDIKDMLPLHVQNKLFNLYDDDIVNLNPINLVQFSHSQADSLSELELKRIFLDKMQKIGYFLDHDKHLDLYNALMNSIGLDEAIEKGEIDPAIVLKRKRGDDKDQDPLMYCMYPVRWEFHGK